MKINFIVKFKVNYYKEGSILNIDEDSRVAYYLPSREETIDLENYYHRSKGYLLNSALTPIGEGYSIVNEPIIIFTLFDIFNMNDSEDDEITEGDLNYIYLLYDDIMEMVELTKFNSLGVSEMYINCIIQEVWTQGFEDWDYHINYIGVVDSDNMKVENIITKKSRERIEIENKILESDYII